jgi:hypothetical protein
LAITCAQLVKVFSRPIFSKLDGARDKDVRAGDRTRARLLAQLLGAAKIQIKEYLVALL